MNWPNSLTISRFVLVPLFLVTFFSGFELLSLIVLLIAGLTDILDGYLARKMKQMTQSGAMLDPLADKAITISVLAALVISERVYWLIALALCLREIIMIVVTVVFYVRKQAMVAANQLGKVTTVIYYIFFTVVLLGWVNKTIASGLLLVLLLFSLIVSGRYAWLLKLETNRHTRV